MVYTCAVTLDQLFKKGPARIGVVGLGYVGLPLAIEFARAGMRVTGVEASPVRMAALKRGRSYIGDVSDSELSRLIKEGLITCGKYHPL
jgi:UDP-N-acetyl-D-glucosamine dehydrogenase